MRTRQAYMPALLHFMVYWGDAGKPVDNYNRIIRAMTEDAQGAVECGHLIPTHPRHRAILEEVTATGIPEGRTEVPQVH